LNVQSLNCCDIILTYDQMNINILHCWFIFIGICFKHVPTWCIVLVCNL